MTSNWQEIHTTLVQCGFNKTIGYSDQYEGAIQVDDYEFTIRLSNFDTDFVSLPSAALVDIPKNIPPHLPHLFHGGICYLDPATVVLDRYNPSLSIKIIIIAIEKVLAQWAEGKEIEQEFAVEFETYWDPKWISYVCSSTTGIKKASKFVRSMSDGSERLEIVVADNDESIKAWRKKRSATEENSVNFSAVLYQIKKTPVINPNIDWPPINIKQFFDWFDSIQQGSAGNLAQLIAKALEKSSLVYVALKTPNGSVGMMITFNNALITKIRPRINSRKPTKKGVDFRQILASKMAVEQLIRIAVEDVSTDFIVNRNLPAGSLADKKIALIGNGTIGGYAASFLAQAGAGTGTGQLDIFDGDILTTANLGRHILGVEYLGEFKSTAMAHYIKKQSPLAQLNINPYEEISATECGGGNYDLLIDATGYEVFSNSLSHHQHRESKRSPILHSWVDAGGMVARSLLDDYTGACYHCLKENREQGQAERFNPLNQSGDFSLPEIKNYCGNSFLPFSTDASVTAAGLIQKMALDFFNQSNEPRFRHLPLSKNASHVKHSNPTALKDCPCCQTIW